MKIHDEEIFHAVADLSVEARKRFFDENNIDANARREVEELLAFDSGSSASLETDIGYVARHALSRFESQGRQCGPYRLGALLGRGGMGAVHLAERIDGEVTQRVAVKLLQPGVDGPHRRRRFLAERQILATLSHPNIARLLDAGHREDGQPYLVMEYMEGQAFDVHASELWIRTKLNLFLKVCAAKEVALADLPEPAAQPNRPLLAIEDALQRLEQIDPLKGRLVEMRFFGGMTAEESSAALSLPVHKVRRELRLAYAWLRRDMAVDSGPQDISLPSS